MVIGLDERGSLEAFSRNSTILIFGKFVCYQKANRQNFGTHTFGNLMYSTFKKRIATAVLNYYPVLAPWWWPKSHLPFFDEKNKRNSHVAVMHFSVKFCSRCQFVVLVASNVFLLLFFSGERCKVGEKSKKFKSIKVAAFTNELWFSRKPAL